MTRNRPDTVIKAINSVMDQTYPHVEIIVSDNSTSNDTYEILSSYVSENKIKYYKQDPMTGIEHINRVHDMAESKYYMIFHDDDTMHPEMVQTLSELVEKNNEASAVASNANIIKNGSYFRLAFKEKKTIALNSVDELISRYHKKYSIAPFPSYMYVKNKVNGLRLNYAHGGKYADVSFLSDLASRGKIIYCPKPLMDYYIHEGQDSNKWDFLQYSTLTDYLKKIVSDKNVVRPLRMKNLYHEILRNSEISLFSKRCQFVIMQAPPLLSVILLCRKIGINVI